MDFYSILKLLHVISATRLGRRRHDDACAIDLRHSRQGRDGDAARARRAWAAWRSAGSFPASLLTADLRRRDGRSTPAFGAKLWIILGLVGVRDDVPHRHARASNRKGKAIKAALARGDEAEALRQGRALLRISKFDYTIMFLVIADMVLKPGLGDASFSLRAHRSSLSPERGPPWARREAASGHCVGRKTTANAIDGLASASIFHPVRAMLMSCARCMTL